MVLKNYGMPDTLKTTNIHYIQDIDEREELPLSPDEIRTEEVQEIMGKVPAWIIRYGMILIGCIIVVFFLCCYFFEYPDVIPARVIITSDNPPVEIVSRSNLPLQQILIQNSETVKKGAVLGILSNSASYEDVCRSIQLCKTLDTTTNLTGLVKMIDVSQNLLLGDLQVAYTNFCQAVLEYQLFMKDNSQTDRINQLKDQSRFQTYFSSRLRERQKKIDKQLSLQEQRIEAASGLSENMALSQGEYESLRIAMLNLKINAEGNETDLLQNQLREKAATKDIADAEIKYQNDATKYEQRIREAARLFSSNYRQWEDKYLFIAPIDGKVTFLKYWSANQFIRAGEAVMVIVPLTGHYIARGQVGINGAGKIKKGQKVLIKLPAYPYEEYGSLRGTVSDRSGIATDSAFAIQIKLPYGLKTNTGVDIAQPKLEGVAEIQTENKSILGRFFENVYGKRRR